MGEVMTVPKLRFKEFAGGWKSFSLLDLSSDKTLNNGVFNDQNKVGKGYKLINVLDMYIDRDIDESRLSLLDLSKQEFERNKVKYGDIFFTRSSLVKEGIAYSNVYLGNSNDITYDGHLIKLSPNLEQINSIFLNYGLKTSKVRKQLIQGGKTATMTTIGQKEIASTKIDVPFLQEQTKIATFLSAVDEKISQLTQKHALLSQYKQGMMQKLFSQQLRFKADNGSEFGEWVSEKISKVFTNKSKSFNPLLNESLPCIELEHLSQNTGQILGIVNSSDQQSTKNLFEPNSVLYGKLRPYLRKFAKPQFKGVCSSEIWVLTGLKISNDYLFQFVQSEQFTELTNIQSGSKMPRADWNVIADAEIKFPCIEEQTKIANFLSAIDQKIEVTAQQIEQAKTWKKGLLQQMFV